MDKTEDAFLRDQFAMAALTGLVGRSPGSETWFASQAYALADAMMKARELK